MGKRKSVATVVVDDSPSEQSSQSANTPAGKHFQVFERVTVRRSMLIRHEQNPRSIDPHAYKKLRDFIKRNKLIGSVQVNRRLTANGFSPSQNNQLVIIGGNQRTRAMDEITGYCKSPGDAPNLAHDYDVPADIIEVSPAKEAEILIALNNVGLQGTFDYDVLSELISSTPDLNPLDTGFDRTELAAFLDSGILEQLMGAPAAAQARVEAPILDQIAEIAATGREQDRADRAEKAGRNLVVPTPSAGHLAGAANADPGEFSEDGEGESDANGAGGEAAEQGRPQDIDGMKQRRKDYQQSINSDTNSAGFMIVLVGDSDNEVEQLLVRLNMPLGQDFYPLSMFLERVSEFGLPSASSVEGSNGGKDLWE